MSAFGTKYKHSESLVLFFGLTHASACFISLMNESFNSELDHFVNVYFGDNLIYGRTLEEHYRLLRKVFERMRAKKLYGKLSKSLFAVQEKEYLWSAILFSGISVEEEKIKSKKYWPRPKRNWSVQVFLGRLIYYRRFFQRCSAISKPLAEHTKNVLFEWNP